MAFQWILDQKSLHNTPRDLLLVPDLNNGTHASFTSKWEMEVIPPLFCNLGSGAYRSLSCWSLLLYLLFAAHDPYMAMDEALHSGYASGCKASRWRCTKAIARGVVQLLHEERRNATLNQFEKRTNFGKMWEIRDLQQHVAHFNRTEASCPGWLCAKLGLLVFWDLVPASLR
jgi:hypothetical protein